MELSVDVSLTISVVDPDDLLDDELDADEDFVFFPNFSDPKSCWTIGRP